MKRKWTDKTLIKAVKKSRSRRQVLIALDLKPKGGNYKVVKNHIERLGLDTSHFLGQGWNMGGKNDWLPRMPLEDILVKHSTYQSYKLKRRLLLSGLKKPKCEKCGWNKKAIDGRIPVELDHINGDYTDNRLENLRILCPNCHSLEGTHRGINMRKHARVVE